VWYLPRLPAFAFSHPIFRGVEETSWLIAALTVLEAYLFPCGLGSLFVNNILIFVTYRNSAGCVDALNEILNRNQNQTRHGSCKQGKISSPKEPEPEAKLRLQSQKPIRLPPEPELLQQSPVPTQESVPKPKSQYSQNGTPEPKNVEAVSKFYQELQIVVGRLNSAFSSSLLFQEFGLLCTIVFFAVGSSKVVQDYTVISICFNLNAVQLLFNLIVQFYPMIVLNLNSRKILSWGRGRKLDSKYLQALVARHRELKIRPMGVHTVTLSTLSGYVVFVVSFILMLHKV